MSRRGMSSSGAMPFPVSRLRLVARDLDILHRLSAIIG